MPNGLIVYDSNSGRLEPGLVWQVDFGGYFLEIGNEVYATGSSREGIARSRELRTCSLDSRHLTGIEQIVAAVDVFGDELGSIVPSPEYDGLVSGAFASKLRSSGLTGYEVRDIVTITNNYSRVHDPKVHYLEFAGNGGVSNRLRVSGRLNACPRCGQTPMACPVCGSVNWPLCVACNQETTYLPELPDYSYEDGFEVCGYPPDVWIVEGYTWDGTDFFRACGVINFVSDRAKIWLEKHAVPAALFRPALLNVEGLQVQ